MKKLTSFFLGVVGLMFVHTSAEAQYAKGSIAGSCTMQVDSSFQITHNGSMDSSGRQIANVPVGVGGATWPVTVCPYSSSNLGVKCADGWKVIQLSIAQMDCRVSSTAPPCWTYWITNACAKL